MSSSSKALETRQASLLTSIAALERVYKENPSDAVKRQLSQMNATLTDINRQLSKRDSVPGTSSENRTQPRAQATTSSAPPPRGKFVDSDFFNSPEPERSTKPQRTNRLLADSPDSPPFNNPNVQPQMNGFVLNQSQLDSDEDDIHVPSIDSRAISPRSHSMDADHKPDLGHFSTPVKPSGAGPHHGKGHPPQTPLSVVKPPPGSVKKPKSNRLLIEDDTYHEKLNEKIKREKTGSDRIVLGTRPAGQFQSIRTIDTTTQSSHTIESHEHASPPNKQVIIMSDDSSEGEDSSDDLNPRSFARPLAPPARQPKNTPLKHRGNIITTSSFSITSSGNTSGASSEPSSAAAVAKRVAPSFIDVEGYFDAMVAGKHDSLTSQYRSANLHPQQSKGVNHAYVGFERGTGQIAKSHPPPFSLIQVVLSMMADLTMLNENPQQLQPASHAWRRDLVSTPTPSPFSFARPLLTRPPLPHQVYSLFWLVTNERDHDYLLHQYHSITGVGGTYMKLQHQEIQPQTGSGDQDLQSSTTPPSNTEGVNPQTNELLRLSFPKGYHIPGLSGGLLCDDCGLGKTFQLISLCTTDLIRSGIFRAIEWVRLALRNWTRREKPDELSPDQQRLQSAALINLFIVLSELYGIITHEKWASRPLLSLRTQIVIYIASLYPVMIREYALNPQSARLRRVLTVLQLTLQNIGITPTQTMSTIQSASQGAAPQQQPRQRQQITIDDDDDDENGGLASTLRPSSTNPTQQHGSQSISSPSGVISHIKQAHHATPKLKLGKTCPLCHDNDNFTLGGMYGAILVVCPKSVVNQWENEIEITSKKATIPTAALSRFCCTGSTASPIATSADAVDQHTGDDDDNEQSTAGDAYAILKSQDLILNHTFIYHAQSRDNLYEEVCNYEDSVSNLREQTKDGVCNCAPRFNYVITTYETLRSDHQRFMKRNEEMEEKKERRRVERARAAVKAKEQNAKRVQSTHGQHKRQLVIDDDSSSSSSDDDSDSSDDDDNDDDDEEVDLKSLTLHDILWSRLIFDESHKVKNISTQNYKAAYALKTCQDDWIDLCEQNNRTVERSADQGNLKGLDVRKCLILRPGGRWCVSATPLHNRVDDLYSMFQLLRYYPYAIPEVWKNIVLQDKRLGSAGAQPANSNKAQSAESQSLIWGIAQSCMIRRERLQKNDVKYFRMVAYLKHQREFRTDNDFNLLLETLGLKPTEKQDDTLRQHAASSSTTNQVDIDNDDDNDDDDNQSDGKTRLVLSTNDDDNDIDDLASALQALDVTGTKPKQQDLYGPYRSKLIHLLPIEPNEPDRPIFVKYHVRLSPLEYEIYDSISNFSKNNLMSGITLNASDDSDDDVDLVSLLSSVNKNNITHPKSAFDRQQKPSYSYANALQVFMLLQQCCNSVFLMTPAYVPIGFYAAFLAITKNSLLPTAEVNKLIGTRFTQSSSSPRSNSNPSSSRVILDESSDDADDNDNADDLAASLTSMSLSSPVGSAHSRSSTPSLMESLTLVELVDIYQRLRSRGVANYSPLLRKALSLLSSPDFPKVRQLMPVVSYGYSSKLAYLMYLLTYISISHPGSHVIVFSQFTRTLDVIENALTNHHGTFNEYLHEFARYSTEVCSECNHLQPNSPVKTEECSTMTDLSDTSAKHCLHAAGLSGYVSNADTDLISESMDKFCSCATCRAVQRRHTKGFQHSVINNPDVNNHVHPEDRQLDEITRLRHFARPYETLYLSSQGIQTHASLATCDVCKTQASQSTSHGLGFQSFSQITRIDGTQTKEEQKHQKKAFHRPVPSGHVLHLNDGLRTFESTHTCQCASNHVTAQPTTSSLNSSMPLPLSVMLVSLKAGGVGLNLVEASHVILNEASWNPMDRVQAMSRASRIGQKKTVFVHELCSMGTIEERVFQVRHEKRLLSKEIVETGIRERGKGSVQMSLKELSKALNLD